MYSVFRGSKYILRERGGPSTSKQFTWLAKEFGFSKVYISSPIPMGNSAIDHMHYFLEASIRKLICNHNTKWDELAHVTMMACNVFPNSSAGEAP